MTTQAKQVARVLRDGKRVRDAVFDQIYPPYIRRASETYWTPVHVALTAARWLAETDSKRLLDVGCGPGKFCVVASLALQRRVTGVEQRKDVVDAAQRAAAAYGANVKLVHGTVEDIEPRRFDAFYLFNPFGENLYDPDDQLDDSVELSPQRSRRDLALVERWLEAAPVGTIALTYHGFGGRIPSTYKLVRSAKQGTDRLRLWTKQTKGLAPGFFLEIDDIVLSSEQLETLAMRVGATEHDALRKLLERALG
jgi:predicted RNA methylase